MKPGSQENEDVECTAGQSADGTAPAQGPTVKRLLSAAARISRFRHGEGGAGGYDALISMADIVPRAISIEADRVRGERKRS